MNISEQAIPANEIADFTAFAESVYPELPKEKPNATPIDVIDATIYTWQQSETMPIEEIESNDLVLALGMLWGNILVEKYNWHWAILTFHEFNNWQGQAIVAPDSSLFMLPFAYIHQCLVGEAEVKVSASLVALDSDVIPSFPPNSFQDLMQGLQRIVPRG